MCGRNNLQSHFSSTYIFMNYFSKQYTYRIDLPDQNRYFKVCKIQGVLIKRTEKRFCIILHLTTRSKVHQTVNKELNTYELMCSEHINKTPFLTSIIFYLGASTADFTSWPRYSILSRTYTFICIEFCGQDIQPPAFAVG